ncbi:PKD domain-containing protein [Methanococcus voltae]|uniref:PKD domain containing protein n=1 Tax=Methanococcus voltae (strain ATCC BAA-1334 / A3) TaxID=456320 RepID=D7DSN7_METV3|nr:PKD domain-containing protein [Methanococcus voltae]MCS3901747.1 hypothetical protein [Methanococcus voltae]
MKLKSLLFLTIILFSISFCNAEQCYYHYDSDNQLLTFKISSIPANSNVTYYVSEDVNSANYNNPNEVYEFYCDADTYDANDWTLGYDATTTIASGRVYLHSNQAKGNMHTKTMYTPNTRLKMNGQIISGTYFGFINDYRLEAGTIPNYQYIYTDCYDSRFRQFYYESSAYTQFITGAIDENNDRLFTIDWYPDKIVSSVNKISVYKDKTIGNTQYVIYRLDAFSSTSFKYMAVQKINQNVEITNTLEDGKLRVNITNNNDFGLSDYQIDMYIPHMYPTSNNFQITNMPYIIDEGLQIQKDKEVINLGDSVQFSVSSNYNIDHYEWDFGDGTTESTTSNIISHTYAKSGNYIIICKAILTNGDVKYNTIDVIVGNEISNAEINFIDELTGNAPSNLSINGVLFTNNNYLINISNNTSYNVTYPEYTIITFTSSDGLIRQVETTNLSSYDILLPPANTYVVQYNIISYSDDKIEVKTTDLKTINVGNKDVVAHLMKGKTYNIFVNGNLYKQIIAKDPDTIYINQNANQEIGSIFDNKLSERIEYNIQPNGQYGQYLVVLSNKDKAMGKVIVVTEKNTDTYITYNEINSTFALTQGYNELDASIYRCEENSEILYDIFVNQNYQNYDVAKYTKFQILTKKIYFESYEPPYFTFTFYLVLCFLISAILFVILSASSGNLHLSLLVSSVIFAVVQDIFHIGTIGKISSGLFLSIAILAWVWTVFKRGAENG